MASWSCQVMLYFSVNPEPHAVYTSNYCASKQVYQDCSYHRLLEDFLFPVYLKWATWLKRTKKTFKGFIICTWKSSKCWSAKMSRCKQEVWTTKRNWDDSIGFWLLSRNFQARLPFDLLSSLSGSLLDGTVFAIVNNLSELQQLTERNNFNERTKIMNEYSSWWGFLDLARNSDQ